MKRKKKPAQSAKYLLRRIEVWKRRYELVVDSRRAQAKEILKYKNQVRDLLERKVRELRLANDSLQVATSTLAANNMEIQELKDQVAVQWKLRSEAQSGVTRGEKLAAEAAARHNRLVQRIHELEVGYSASSNEIMNLTDALSEAQRKFSYRIWVALSEGYRGSRMWIQGRYLLHKNRLIAWWMVRRLSPARVRALNEGGYIPRDLVRMAYAYWEQDKRRAVEMRNVHDYSTVVLWARLTKMPTLWRRFRIWMGKA